MDKILEAKSTRANKFKTSIYDYNSLIINSFCSYFVQSKYKLKEEPNLITAVQKKALIELWLPHIEDKYYGSHVMFRLTAEFENLEVYLIIMTKNDNNGGYNFKLINQSKRTKESKTDYPLFTDFRVLLDHIIKDCSTQAVNKYSKYAADDPFEDGEEFSLIKK